MCGIVGYFNFKNTKVFPVELLRKMNDSLYHRGPDEYGEWYTDYVGLAMRRLAIVDLKCGKQPMFNRKRTTVTVFNGEIYNHGALRASLEAHGRYCLTNSDTEVLAEIVETHNPSALQLLDGMFAFASYKIPSSPREDSHGALFIARDRLGKKPLYYAEQNGSLVFASELRALLCVPWISREIDPDAIAAYLSLHCIPAPLSIFKSIRKLEPGSWLSCDSGGLRTGKYAISRKLNALPRGTGRKEVVETVKDLLVSAVRKRMVSEVPMGTFLSGGLDSSIITALLSQQSGHPIKTFSLTFGEQSNNEARFAREVSSHYSTIHHETLVSSLAFRDIETFVDNLDEPFADESCLPLLVLAKAARQDVKVVLTGDGGDEVFGGYEMYLFQKWARMALTFGEYPPKVLKVAASSINGSLRHWGLESRLIGRIIRLLSGVGMSPAERRIFWWSTMPKREAEKMMIEKPLVSRAKFDVYKYLESKSQHAAGEFEKMLKIDSQCILPEYMLTKVDRMTMAASIEARSPLLDIEIRDYMDTVPADMMLPGYNNSSLKSILKDAARGILPEKIIERKKHGLNIPLDKWFRTDLFQIADTAFKEPKFGDLSGISQAAAVQLLERHRRSEGNFGARIYALLVLEFWLRKNTR